MAAAAGSLPAYGAAAAASGRVWETAEWTFSGPAAGNPFAEVTFAATFTLGNRKVQLNGFYDGDGVYRLRFLPDAPGLWTYETDCNVPALKGKAGSLRVEPAAAGARGPVRVDNLYHFRYSNGEPYAPFGTTCYAWIHQSEELQQRTLRTLAGAPFNKLRMCVFPKSYEYNHNEPALYPFERDAGGKSDFLRPNPAFFRHLEQRVQDLEKLGIEADLILFHPYDRWGYASMPREADELYLRYVVARLSALRNVWWSLANEFDLMRAKTTADFDRLAHLVAQCDPVSHLRSIHYSRVMYDYAQPWVTHASLQTYDFDRAPALKAEWKKPLVYDEIQYEGNLNKRWGNLSGAEMVRRCWLAVIRGCYVTHGETYLEGEATFNEDVTPTLWWSHGGELHGTSPKAIRFLRGLVETALRVPGSRLGLEPTGEQYYLNASVIGDGGEVLEILYYFDFHQPVWYEFPLPAGSFRAELIDPEAGSVKAVAEVVSGKAKVVLAARPYQAVRFRRA